MPGFNEVDDYPERLIIDGLKKPHHVVLIHWEDFFQKLPDTDKSAELRTVAHEPAKRFLERLEAVLPPGDYKLPAPGVWMQFAP